VQKSPRVNEAPAQAGALSFKASEMKAAEALALGWINRLDAFSDDLAAPAAALFWSTIFGHAAEKLGDDFPGC